MVERAPNHLRVQRMESDADDDPFGLFLGGGGSSKPAKRPVSGRHRLPHVEPLGKENSYPVDKANPPR